MERKYTRNAVPTVHSVLSVGLLQVRVKQHDGVVLWLAILFTQSWLNKIHSLTVFVQPETVPSVRSFTFYSQLKRCLFLFLFFKPYLASHAD